MTPPIRVRRRWPPTRRAANEVRIYRRWPWQFACDECGGPSLLNRIATTQPAALAAGLAHLTEHACPGYEPAGDNPCTCPCPGCRHHCSACHHRKDDR